MPAETTYPLDRFLDFPHSGHMNTSVSVIIHADGDIKGYKRSVCKDALDLVQSNQLGRLGQQIGRRKTEGLRYGDKLQIDHRSGANLNSGDHVSAGTKSVQLTLNGKFLLGPAFVCSSSLNQPATCVAFTFPCECHAIAIKETRLDSCDVRYTLLTCERPSTGLNGRSVVETGQSGGELGPIASKQYEISYFSGDRFGFSLVSLSPSLASSFARCSAMASRINSLGSPYPFASKIRRIRASISLGARTLRVVGYFALPRPIKKQGCVWLTDNARCELLGSQANQIGFINTKNTSGLGCEGLQFCLAPSTQYSPFFTRHIFHDVGTTCHE